MTLYNTAPEPKSPLASLRGDHAGFLVSNLEVALVWYQQKLDFRLVGRSEAAGLRFAMLAPAADDTFRLELMENSRSIVQFPEAVDLASGLDRAGWNHVCLRVVEIDRVTVELERRGVQVLLQPLDNDGYKVRIAFIADPWGNIIELLEQKMV